MNTRFDPAIRADCVAQFARRHGVSREVAETSVPVERPDVVLLRKARERARQTGATYRDAARDVLRDDFMLAEAWMFANGTL